MAIIPVSVIVAALCFSIAPVSTDVFIMFIIGAIMLVFGMALFTLGAETSMTVIGERVGVQISRNKSWIIGVILIIFIGTIIVIAEPDLTVFAEQIQEIPTSTMVIISALGSGVLLALAFFRNRFKIKLKHILMVLYGLVFVLTIFTPKYFWAIAFDAGSVATGAISVPFIVAMGAGATLMRSDKNAEKDTFGLLAICSVGPIITVLVLGLFYNVNAVSYTVDSILNLSTSLDVWNAFKVAIPDYMYEVGMSLLPILILFMLFRIFAFKMTKNEVIKIVIGMFFTYVGLVLFLTGANVGFMPAGSFIGEALANTGNIWLIVPIGMLLGYFMVKAEPAVVVLVKQISDITDGAISEKIMMVSQEIGLALAIGLSMIRIITGISILWILLPCYLLAFILSFFTPEIFTSIAFDSGGVASGTMTAVFLIPFSIGICNVYGGNVLTDAFGIVATAGAIPIVCIQLVGLLYKFKTKNSNKAMPIESDKEIIDIDWVWANE